VERSRYRRDVRHRLLAISGVGSGRRFRYTARISRTRAFVTRRTIRPIDFYKRSTGPPASVVTPFYMSAADADFGGKPLDRIAMIQPTVAV